MGTDCKDWYKTIRNFLSSECGGGANSIDKTVFLSDSTKFGYEYGVGFRDKNTSNLDHGILKVEENFETGEQRNAIGLVSIRDDLLNSGSEMFIEYITHRKQSSNRVHMKKTNRYIWGCGFPK